MRQLAVDEQQMYTLLLNKNVELIKREHGDDLPGIVPEALRQRINGDVQWDEQGRGAVWWKVCKGLAMAFREKPWNANEKQ